MIARVAHQTVLSVNIMSNDDLMSKALLYQYSNATDAFSVTRHVNVVVELVVGHFYAEHIVFTVAA